MVVDPILDYEGRHVCIDVAIEQDVVTETQSDDYGKVNVLGIHLGRLIDRIARHTGEVTLLVHGRLVEGTDGAGDADGIDSCFSEQRPHILGKCLHAVTIGQANLFIPHRLAELYKLFDPGERSRSPPVNKLSSLLHDVLMLTLMIRGTSEFGIE